MPTTPAPTLDQGQLVQPRRHRKVDVLAAIQEPGKALVEAGEAQRGR